MGVMIKVSAERVIEVLREVVAERPDYVYSAPEGRRAHGATCFYVHGEGTDAVPGCVVGVVLNRLGVPLEDLAEYEGDTAQHMATRFLTTPLSAADVLRRVQIEQDQGASWATALSHSDPQL